MTKAEDRRGKRGQNIAKACLERLGIEMVEKIATPVGFVPVNPKQSIYKVFWQEEVSGDHRGILPGGLSVLAETKTIYDHNLRWSDLRDHQPDRLREHAEWGGLSLLVWVNGENYEDVYVMRFPIVGFGSGKSISLEWAKYFHEETKRFIFEHSVTNSKIVMSIRR